MATLFQRNTQTQANTGGSGAGARYDLDPDYAGSPTTVVAATNNDNTPVLLAAWHKTVNTNVYGYTFYVSWAVTGFTNSPGYYSRVARYNSAGILQANSSFGSARFTAGVFTDTHTLATTWNMGDQLVLEVWGWRESGTLACDVTFGTDRSSAHFGYTQLPREFVTYDGVVVTYGGENVYYDHETYMDTFVAPVSAEFSATNIVNETAGSTNLYLSVDEPAEEIDDDTTYLTNATNQTGTVVFGLTGFPSDIDTLETLRMRIRARRET